MRPSECFRILLKTIQPEAVLDIGSRDGRDALLFRRVAPRAQILAFEAHPKLFEAMEKNEELAKAGIRAYGIAISNTNGISSFSIFHGGKELGSLRSPVSHWLPVTETFSVETRRLDSISELRSYKNMAMWVDVEGCSYEVMEGLGDLVQSVSLIHAEVENQRLWENQRLVGDLLRSMKTNGLVPVALDGKARKYHQSNVVFLRQDLARSWSIQRVIMITNLLHLFALKMHVRKARYRLRKKFPGLHASIKRVMRPAQKR